MDLFFKTEDSIAMSQIMTLTTGIVVHILSGIQKRNTRIWYVIREDGSLILLDKCGSYVTCSLDRFLIKWLHNSGESEESLL